MGKSNNVNSNEGIAPISIDYTANGVKTTKNYELMVVACDPRNLVGICNFDNIELGIFSKLQNFTFHTTLVTVPVKSVPLQKHGVVFAPYLLDKMQGSVYAYRNESAKRFGLDISNQMDENLITIYQLIGPTDKPYTPGQFAAILAKELPSLFWWPYGLNYKIEQTVTTPYFDHFSQSDLKAAVPWTFLSRQGYHNTLYVHASTCFESVLDCWGYENMLLLGEAKLALPASKSAPIAILGAGVSGLLFAVKLKRLGYTNIDLLESTDRYGGKTHTITMDGPHPPGGPYEPTYCELGTCYMSPAYEPMIKDLSEYLEGNEQIQFGKQVNRGIVTTDQLPPSFNAPLVMDNSTYVIRKAEAELGLAPGSWEDVDAKLHILAELTRYIGIHYDYFDGASPMPSTPPKSFLDQHASKTFIEFLRFHDLKAIIGILQYGYEVQGYGTLNTIPAFYGLVWISPPIIAAMIDDAVLDGKTPIVTAWSKGWGDLWTQIVTKEKLNITYNTTINTIKRLS